MKCEGLPLTKDADNPVLLPITNRKGTLLSASLLLEKTTSPKQFFNRLERLCSFDILY